MFGFRLFRMPEITAPPDVLALAEAYVASLKTKRKPSRDVARFHFISQFYQVFVFPTAIGGAPARPNHLRTASKL